MTSCADQWAGSAPIEGNAHAHARKYSTAGLILPDCHKLKYLLLLAQILAAILSATGVRSSAHLLPRNPPPIASTTSSNDQQQQLARISGRLCSTIGTSACAQQLPQNLHAIASTTGANAQQQQLAGISSRTVSTTGTAACAQQLPGIRAGSTAGIARQDWRCSTAENQQGLAITISGMEECSGSVIMRRNCIKEA